MTVNEYLKQNSVETNARFNMFDEEDYAFGWVANTVQLLQWFGEKEFISLTNREERYEKVIYDLKINMGRNCR